MLSPQVDSNVSLPIYLSSLLSSLTPSKRLLRNNFREAEELGKGSQGSVVKVVDEFGKQYARKQFINVTGEPQVQNIVNEINIMLTCDQENLVRCYGYDYEYRFENSIVVLDFYIFLELGLNNLEFLLKTDSKFFTPEMIKKINLSMLSAGRYLHKKGIAHRDIKPDNIIIFDNGVKLCDFGSAKVNIKFNEKKDQQQLQSEFFVMGNTCTPEDFRHDIQCLGVTMLRIACPEWGQHLNDKAFGMLQIKRKIEEVSKFGRDPELGVLLGKVFSYSISCKMANFAELWELLSKEKIYLPEKKNIQATHTEVARSRDDEGANQKGHLTSLQDCEISKQERH